MGKTHPVVMRKFDDRRGGRGLLRDTPRSHVALLLKMELMETVRQASRAAGSLSLSAVRRLCGLDASALHCPATRAGGYASPGAAPTDKPTLPAGPHAAGGVPWRSLPPPAAGRVRAEWEILSAGEV